MRMTPDAERRANRRFWLGLAGFLALLAAILVLGLVLGEGKSAQDPAPNASVAWAQRA